MEDGTFTQELKDGPQIKSKLVMEKFTTVNGLHKYVNSMVTTMTKSVKALPLIHNLTKFFDITRDNIFYKK